MEYRMNFLGGWGQRQRDTEATALGGQESSGKGNVEMSVHSQHTILQAQGKRLTIKLLLARREAVKSREVRSSRGRENFRRLKEQGTNYEKQKDTLRQTNCCGFFPLYRKPGSLESETKQTENCINIPMSSSAYSTFPLCWKNYSSGLTTNTIGL